MAGSNATARACVRVDVGGWDLTGLWSQVTMAQTPKPMFKMIHAVSAATFLPSTAK
jgi:hypothetical protein